MVRQLWDDDDLLLADLGVAVRRALPVPARLRRAARAAFSWRRVDAELELAQLVYDSAADLDCTVRSTPGRPPRMLVFEAAALSVELEIGRHVVGQLLPPTAGVVFLTSAEGSVATTRADVLGAFVLDGAPVGPVQLTCRTEAGVLVTDWVRVSRC